MASDALSQPPHDEYASVEETRVAITALSNDDYIKLMVIASFFCHKRGLRHSQLEPDELLSEAMFRTLNGERRWRKDRVSIIRHLDRCMESISGHVVAGEVAKAKMSATMLAADFDEKKQSPRATQRADAEEHISALDELKRIRTHLAESPIALQVLLLRAEGYTESEITLRLGIGKKGYEAARKKIERMMATYLRDGRTQHE
jgi:hypothetical protein